MIDDGRVNERRAAAGGDGAGEELVLDQVFDGGSLYALRATLEAHAVQAGFPEGRAMDVVITGHELATNAVIHGGGEARVRLWRVPGGLRCRVGDAGRPGGPAEDPAGWPVRHGHGLWIARNLADEFAIAWGPEGTVATVAFASPPDGQGRAFGLRVERRGSHVLLELSGPLDDRADRELAVVVGQLLDDGAAPRLVVDLAGVTFWDAMGVAALVTVQQRVIGAGAGAMALTGVAPGFGERLDALSPAPFVFCGSAEEAVRLWDGSAAR